MKKTILLLMSVLVLASCMNEGDSGCPADLSLKFLHQDEFDPLADYDNTIKNEVLLCVFKNKKFVHSMTIPYADIMSGKTYSIRKTKDLEGQLDLFAWAVSADDGDIKYLPSLRDGDDLSTTFLELQAKTRAVDCLPYTASLFMGSVSTTEQIDLSSTHTVQMINSACKVRVNVLDNIAHFEGNTAEKPQVIVSGSMNRMNMDRAGVGEEALVFTDLTRASSSSNEYSTGWFGILPSGSNQNSVEVEVVHENKTVAISIPGVKARSGGRIEVSIELGVNVDVIVDGYRIQGVQVTYI